MSVPRSTSLDPAAVSPPPSPLSEKRRIARIAAGGASFRGVTASSSCTVATKPQYRHSTPNGPRKTQSAWMILPCIFRRLVI
ncbi:hypothetical protein RRF57_009074 [Xylaria bambusicola]|uniref:Uncharacterized protein n=1 Tax=Xylaria bambusicola TaxID=326684 RepID=A0AAN7UUZ2_9PEZI